MGRSLFLFVCWLASAFSIWDLESYHFFVFLFDWFTRNYAAGPTSSGVASTELFDVPFEENKNN